MCVYVYGRIHIDALYMCVYTCRERSTLGLLINYMKFGGYIHTIVMSLDFLRY